MKHLFMFAIALGLPGLCLAQGGSGVGNGGSGVVCYNKNARGKKTIAHAYSLDLWEATHEADHLKIDLGSEEIDEFQKVDILIERVRKVDPRFGNELEDRFDKFKKSYEVQDRVAIKKIDDTRTLVDPKGDCERYQIAVQKKIIDPFFDKKFQFDESAWNKMSANERAGLIFHEIVYWSEIENGVEDSFGVRRIVGAFASQFGSNISMQVYIGLIKKYLTHKFYEWGQLQLSIQSNDQILFNAQGTPAQARLTNSISLKKFGTRMGEILTYQSIKDQVYQFDGNQEIVDGPLTLIEVTRIAPRQILRFSIDPAKSDRYQTGMNNIDLTKIASQVIVKHEDMPQTITYSASEASELMDTGGYFFALRTPLIDLTHWMVGFNLSFQTARTTGLLLSDEGTISGILVEVTPQMIGWLNDLNSPQGKHELSWKPNGLYQVRLDFEKKMVISVR